MRTIFDFLLKILGFKSEEYLRRREAFKDAAKYDPPFIKTYITPFNFVVFTFNFLAISLLFASVSHKLNMTGFGVAFMYATTLLISSVFCVLVYLILDSTLFNKINSLKRSEVFPELDDSFPKMLVKIFISCIVSYVTMLLISLI